MTAPSDWLASLIVFGQHYACAAAVVLGNDIDPSLVVELERAENTIAGLDRKQIA